MTGRQPREHPVSCQRCLRRKTWNLDAICDACRLDHHVAGEGCPVCGHDHDPLLVEFVGRLAGVGGDD
jgi:hypothetical protein